MTLLRRVPREPPAQRARDGQSMDAQLRDMAIFFTIVLLLVLTLQLLWLTSSERSAGRRR